MHSLMTAGRGRFLDLSVPRRPRRMDEGRVALVNGRTLCGRAAPLTTHASIEKNAREKRKGKASRRRVA
jgi:hypothetical protein